MATSRCLISIAALLVFSLSGCDRLLTTGPEPGETTDGIMDNPPSIQAAFLRGDEQFARIFTVPDGLGPIFNQPSCETCHPGDGRGTP
ncbi:MAG: thiol oxidoreductase, partial [bacterium]|nr:thiol oxidoreductase [bacterium]